MKEEEKLSHKDIEILMKDHSAVAKVKVVEKLAAQYNTKGFTQAQVTLAEQIFRLLLRQAEIEVRKALSENLMHSTLVPHDVVLSLAKDVEEVATPVLEFSQVLTEDDLIQIITSSEKVAAQLAVSRRQTVPEKVSNVLIGTKNPEVVNSLVRNEGAKISDKGYSEIIDNFAGSENIVDAMITRGSIAPSVIENLTARVSRALQEQIEKKYQNKFKDINTFFKEGSEIASLKFLSKQKIDKDLMDLVDDLEKTGELVDYLDPINGKLTQLLDGLEEIGRTTPFAALTMGHLTLFEISLSRLTGVPFANIRKLCMDAQGFKALYEKAKLPPKLYDPVQFILLVVKSMEVAAETNGTPRAHKDLFLFTKNITAQARGKQVPNLAHLISIIHHNAEEILGEW